MYFPDVVTLKQFYASALGRMVHAIIWKQLRAFWPEAKGETLLGLGFVMPYLPEEANGTALVCMPAGQGAMYWPSQRGNRVTLAHEITLPFAEGVFNRVLVMHALEHSSQATQTLKELWRVLTPGGRVLIAVPNRMGMWSRSGENPFAHGRPFNLRQMRDVLSEGGFTYLRCASVLFVPPLAWRWVLRIAPWMEMVGQVFFPMLGGVLIVEAEKQVYAAVREPVYSRVLQPVPAYSIAPSTMDGVSS